MLHMEQASGGKMNCLMDALFELSYNWQILGQIINKTTNSDYFGPINNSTRSCI